MTIPDFKIANVKGADRWLLSLFILFAICIVGSTCYAVIDNYHAIPFMDHWTYFGGFFGRAPGLGVLWEQYNEHRLLFPKLLFLLDRWLTGATGHLLIFLNLSLQALHALLLAIALRKNEAMGAFDKRTLALAAVVFSFWLTQYENFLWPFQIQWELNGLFASWAAFLACRADSSAGRISNWGNIFSAAFCCAVATYSQANGVFMWGVILAVMLKSRLSREFLLFWAVFGVALAASYLFRYASPPHHASAADTLHWRTLHYFLVYLGNPFSRLGVAAATLAGGLGLTLFSFFAWRFLAKRQVTFFEKFGFALIAYVVVTAAITAAARNNFGVDQAFAGRYQMPVLLFWFAALALAFSSVKHSSRLRWMRLALLLFTVFWLLPVQARVIAYLPGCYLKSDEAFLALLAGVQDSSALRFVYPYDAEVLERMDFLRRYNLSVYREPWTRNMGRSLQAVFAVDSGIGMRGEVEEMRLVSHPARGGFFVHGRLHRAGEFGRPSVMLFARGDTIVGFAKTRKRKCRGCFSGYVRGSNGRIKTYTLDRDASHAREILLNPAP